MNYVRSTPGRQEICINNGAVDGLDGSQESLNPRHSWTNEHDRYESGRLAEFEVGAEKMDSTVKQNSKCDFALQILNESLNPIIPSLNCIIH
jgi:hypothetical protein